MSESFWTTRHSTYGVGFGVLVMTGAMIGAYFDDLYHGIIYGSVAAIIYAVIRIVQWVRNDQ